MLLMLFTGDGDMIPPIADAYDGSSARDLLGGGIGSVFGSELFGLSTSLGGMETTDLSKEVRCIV